MVISTTRVGKTDMRTCDVAAVGLGLMGSAALEALVNSGVDALGFDPLGLGSNRGSSHGSCRVFRRFNFENDNYTDLSDAALKAWNRLEADSGVTVKWDNRSLQSVLHNDMACVGIASKK
jgi:glycine/D-amino acid oxidase-like deaminating enzyme